MRGIAISGLCGAGKTTTATYIRMLTGRKKVAEGTMLRNIVGLLGLPEDRVYLQEIGEKLREVVPTIWLDALLHNEGCNSYVTWGTLVIDDIRHPEDMDKLKTMDFITIRVNTHEDLRKERLLARDGINALVGIDRPSEHLLDDYQFDYVIENNGDREDLFDQIRQLKVKGVI